MLSFGDTEAAFFLRRLNRFSAQVTWQDRIIMVHLPNSGRMTELLVPNRPVLLTPKFTPKRQTNFDLILVTLDNFLVSVDARLPSQIIYNAFASNFLPQFQGYSQIKKEVSIGHNRFDLLLSNPQTNESYLIEVKSVTKVTNGIALFPDAVTSRGKRHLDGLINARTTGYKAAIIFVVQRPDAIAFSPDVETDPIFAQKLRSAKDQGVVSLAYTCHVTKQCITLAQEIPVYT